MKPILFIASLFLILYLAYLHGNLVIKYRMDSLHNITNRNLQIADSINYVTMNGFKLPKGTYTITGCDFNGIKSRHKQIITVK